MSTENANIPPSPADDGFVPRLGADPSSARYELLDAAQAVERIAAVGFDRADAQLMVEQYLAPTIAEFGPGPGDGWGVDTYDLAEIARGYEWVDHYRGETIADARARAADYAARYAQAAVTVDREQDPGRAGRLDREAVVWADRARAAHNPWPVPDTRLDQLTEAEQGAEIEAASSAPFQQDDTAEDTAVDTAEATDEDTDEATDEDTDEDTDGDGGPGGGVAAPVPAGPVRPLDTGAGAAPPGTGPPTAREIADLTARLRALTGRPGTDDAERAAFLVDKQELLDRIPVAGTGASLGADDRSDEPLDAVETAMALERLGYSGDQAETMVLGFLDATGRAPLGTSTDDAFVYRSELPTITARYAAGDFPDLDDIDDFDDFDDEGDFADDGRRYVEFGDWGRDQDEDGYYDERGVAVDDRDGPTLPPLLPEWIREQARRTEGTEAGISVTELAGLHAGRDELLRSVSWAVAARDAAIERGGSAPAGRLAQQAREAIIAAEAAGISREQLAAELNYPGGAAELDGDHIRIGIVSGEPMTAVELAEQDAAWTRRGEHPADIWGPLAAVDAARVDGAGDPGAVVHTFDPADGYTSAEIGAIAAAHARGDDAEVARLEAGRPSMVSDRAAAGEPVEVEIPEWIREAARRTEAEIAAGTYVPGPPDDMEQIAAELAELRAARDELVSSVSWAVAARDAAIERGDTVNAAQFAEQARAALGATDHFGISRERLAAELDYPGGAAELDGEHVDLSVSTGVPLDAATLAGWDAAWDAQLSADAQRALTHVRTQNDRCARPAARLFDMSEQRWDDALGELRGHGYTLTTTTLTGGDTATNETGYYLRAPYSTPDTPSTDDADDDAADDDLADGPSDTAPDSVPDAAVAHARAAGGADGADPPGRNDPAWWALPGPDEVALTHREVAEELGERGFTPEQARAAVTDYLDETSHRLGISVHQWAMDSHDVEAIAQTHRRDVPVPEQRHPSTAEQTAQQTATTDYWFICGPAPLRPASGRDDRAQVRDDDPRGHDQTTAGTAHNTAHNTAHEARKVLTADRPGPTDDVEADRRDQLVRWHTDDTATEHDLTHGSDSADHRADHRAEHRAEHGADGYGDGLVRALDDIAPAAATTSEEG